MLMAAMRGMVERNGPTDSPSDYNSHYLRILESSVVIFGEIYLDRVLMVTI